MIIPLPIGGKTPWPPKDHADSYRRFAEYGAWYSGDPDRLASVYGGAASIDSILGVPAASSKDNGRVGWRRWFFWGRRSSALPYQRHRLHVPLASEIATVSSDLLFANSPALQIAEAHVNGASADALACQCRFDEIIEADNIPSTLIEAGEAAAAFGGVFLRVVWDQEFAPRPLLTVVQADAAVPEYRWGELDAVTFWSVVGPHDEGEVWRHLERHEKGYIYHGLYQGDKNDLGRARPLSSLPETARYPEFVPTGLDMLTAVYIPNMKPSRRIVATDEGRSDYAGAEGLLDALDEVYTSWMRDLRLARARIIMPAEYLQSFGKGKGAAADIDQEVFTKLEGMTAEEGQITMNQFAIRFQEHYATAKAYREQVITGAGYSYSTFGESGDERSARPATATEVVARERRSLITREKKVQYCLKPLTDILDVLLQIDFKVFGGPEPVRPKVLFPNGAPRDPAVLAGTLNLLEQARAVSTATKVQAWNPTWDPEQVAAEVQLIDNAPRPPGAPALVGQQMDPMTGQPMQPPDMQPPDNTDSGVHGATP